MLRPDLPRGYRALRLLRRGAGAEVFDGFSEERGARCILKVPRGSDPRDARALAAEGRLLLSLSHPHVVRAYALLRRPAPTLVLETLPGETLSHLLARRRRRRLAARDVAQLGAQLASALAYLHRAGWVHLDVKPSNVVCHGGLVKLLDFGIARRPGRVGRGVGTAAYLAPEQARGGRVGPAADVFALGAVLYEAATGAAPFSSRRRAGDAVPPVRGRRRLPAALARMIDACLAGSPLARPRSEEVRIALARLARARPRRPQARRSRGSSAQASRGGNES